MFLVITITFAIDKSFWFLNIVGQYLEGWKPWVTSFAPFLGLLHGLSVILLTPSSTVLKEKLLCLFNNLWNLCTCSYSLQSRTCVCFQVFIVVTVQIVVWFVTLCHLVVGYQHFRGVCCLHHSIFLLTLFIPMCYLIHKEWELFSLTYNFYC